MADEVHGSRDVLVVGAGPVGLTLAAELQRYGATCRIVDRAAVPSDKSKAVIVHARTLEHFDHLELERAFLARGTMVHSVSFFVRSERVAQLKFDGTDTRYPFVLCIPQDVTENILGDRLAETGLKVERSVEFIDFVQDDTGVTSRLRHPDGSIEGVRTTYLVGCDGSRSTVRDRAGITFDGLSYDEEWILADVQLETDFFTRDEASLFVEPHSFLAVFPLPGDRWRLITVRKIADPTEAAAPATVAEFEAVLLKHTGAPVRVFDPIWITPFRIGHKQADHLRAGRVFIAGDSAHIHSQVGGQGMNTGLQDAINLGWKLALAVRDQAQPRLLDTYEEERLPVIRSVLWGTDLATRAFTLRRKLDQQALNLLGRYAVGLLPVHNYLTRAVTQLGINYRARGYTDAAKGDGARHWGRRRSRPVALPGDHAPRAPHLKILPESTTIRLYDLLRHNGHTVVVLQGKRPSNLAAGDVAEFAKEARATFGEDLHFIGVRLRDTWKADSFDFPLVQDVAGEMHQAYDVATPMVVVIRPDCYIAYRAAWESRNTLAPFLHAYIRSVDARSAAKAQAPN